MEPLFSRRRTIGQLSGLFGGVFLPFSPAKKPDAAESFRYCLNMSTLRGHKLGFEKELQIAAQAGFRSVEVWVDSVQDYVKQGKTLADARKLITDLGLTVENAIGFAPWIVDDAGVRSKALEQMKREMDMLAGIGCKRTAAPPMGATTSPKLDLTKVAERYRIILELGTQTGVMPHLELWGFSSNLSKLSEVMYVALESGHPSARLLLDVYHLYKGGSSLASLPLVGKPAMEIFHVNDYPANLTAEKITDADRIFTGDGVAPIQKILKAIHTPEQPLILSLEVFNKSYYAQDPLTVAKNGLAKMKAVTGGV